MGLDALIAKGVAIADKSTKDLQPQIMLKQWIGDDGFGGKKFGTPFPINGILTTGELPILEGGVEKVASAYLAVLSPIPPVTAKNRQNPVDPQDVFTLPDGSAPAILKISGFVSKSTSVPYFSEIWFK